MPEEKPIRKNQPVAEPNPAPGCAMFVVGGLVIVTIIVWAAFSFFRQRSEILKFTDERSVELVQPAVDETARISAAAKLAAMQSNKAAGELSLNADELRALLNSDKSCETLRRSVALESITDQLQFRAVIPFTNLGRFMNDARVTAVPEVTKDDGLRLKSLSLEVPGKTIPEDFVKGYHEQGFFSQLVFIDLKANATIAPFLKRITEATCKDGVLMLKYGAAK